MNVISFFPTCLKQYADAEKKNVTMYVPTSWSMDKF